MDDIFDNMDVRLQHKTIVEYLMHEFNKDPRAVSPTGHIYDADIVRSSLGSILELFYIDHGFIPDIDYLKNDNDMEEFRYYVRIPCIICNKCVNTIILSKDGIKIIGNSLCE